MHRSAPPVSARRQPPRPAALAALVALLAPVATNAQPGGGPPPALVRTDAVRTQEVEQRRAVTGALRSPRRALLAAEAEGVLVELVPQEGDFVATGTVIARVDDALLARTLRRERAATAAARASVSEREADVAKAERDLGRSERLWRDSQAVSETVVDDARSALESARARLERARADVLAAEAVEALAEQRLADATVRAPFAGHVVRAPAELGEWVRPGDPLVELVATQAIEAWLQVPEDSLERLSAVGARVEVRVPAAGLARMAAVTSVVPDVDLQAHTFPVLVALDNSEGRLAPGMRVVAQVPTRERATVLTVHPDAILRDDAGERVFLVEDGSARALRVETLFLTGDRVAVRATGLSDGSLVVIEGNERLMPGQPVRTPGS